jgi:hypothetical protein
MLLHVAGSYQFHLIQRGNLSVALSFSLKNLNLKIHTVLCQNIKPTELQQGTSETTISVQMQLLLPIKTRRQL